MHVARGYDIDCTSSGRCEGPVRCSDPPNAPPPVLPDHCRRGLLPVNLPIILVILFESTVTVVLALKPSFVFYFFPHIMISHTRH